MLHVYDHGRATMRGKLLSLVPVLDASGPEMDRGETVTVFNDMAVLAPAALLSAPVVWEGLSDRQVRGTFTNGEQVVSATLHFNALHELVDFVSDDRLRASSDGTTFTPQTWSTPVERYGRFGGHWSAAVAVARWHAPAPEGAFTYVELAYDDIAHDPLTMLTPLRRRAGMAAVERPVHQPPAGSSGAPGRSSSHPRDDGRGF